MDVKAHIIVLKLGEVKTQVSNILNLDDGRKHTIAYLYTQGHKRSKHSITHWVANPHTDRNEFVLEEIFHVIAAEAFGDFAL